MQYLLLFLHFSYGLLDITSTDKKCLLNCISASLYSLELQQILGRNYKNGRSKGENYERFYQRINCKNVNFPAGMNDIKILEKNNPNFRFHIWTMKKSDFYKIYETKVTEHHKTIEKLQKIL